MLEDNCQALTRKQDVRRRNKCQIDQVVSEGNPVTYLAS